MKGTLLSVAVWLYRWVRDASLPERAGVGLLLAAWTAGSLWLSVRFYDRRRRGLYG